MSIIIAVDVVVAIITALIFLALIVRVFEKPKPARYWTCSKCGNDVEEWENYCSCGASILDKRDELNE